MTSRNASTSHYSEQHRRIQYPRQRNTHACYQQGTLTTAGLLVIRPLDAPLRLGVKYPRSDLRID